MNREFVEYVRDCTHPEKGDAVLALMAAVKRLSDVYVAEGCEPEGPVRGWFDACVDQLGAPEYEPTLADLQDEAEEALKLALETLYGVYTEQCGDGASARARVLHKCVDWVNWI